MYYSLIDCHTSYLHGHFYEPFLKLLPKPRILKNEIF